VAEKKKNRINNLKNNINRLNKITDLKSASKRVNKKNVGGNLKKKIIRG
jgi:hypothetical protein